MASEPRIKRNVHAPEWELGTDAQAAQWLGVQVAEWKKVTDRLGMEPAMRISRQTYYWNWRQVVGVTLIGTDLTATDAENATNN